MQKEFKIGLLVVLVISILMYLSGWKKQKDYSNYRISYERKVSNNLELINKYTSIVEKKINSLFACIDDKTFKDVKVVKDEMEIIIHYLTYLTQKEKDSIDFSKNKFDFRKDLTEKNTYIIETIKKDLPLNILKENVKSNLLNLNSTNDNLEDVINKNISDLDSFKYIVVANKLNMIFPEVYRDKSQFKAGHIYSKVYIYKRSDCKKIGEFVVYASNKEENMKENMLVEFSLRTSLEKSFDNELKKTLFIKNIR